MYEPLWRRLSPETRDKVLKSNYERIFDAARTKVRAWEAHHTRREPVPAAPRAHLP
jgi:hypothetical protein